MFQNRLLKNWSYIVIGLFFVITILYLLLFQEGIILQVHDFCDSWLAVYKMMGDEKLFFLADNVPILGGISRNYFPSGWKLYSFLYMIFPAFFAVVMNWYLKITLSIWGFSQLGKVMVQDYEAHKNVILSCGLLYGLLPLYPPAALGFASLPLLLALFVRIYKGAKPRHYIYLGLYPVLADFSVFGIFICGYLLLFLLLNWILEKKFPKKMALAFGVLCIGYVLIEWRLFYVMFFETQKSIRSTFVSTYLSFGEVCREGVNAFLKGQYHSASLHTYVVLPVCAIYFFWHNGKRIKERRGKEILQDPFNILFLVILFNVMVCTLDYLKSFHKILEMVFPSLSGFNFSRTLWFNPFLWYLAFCLVICRIPKKWLQIGLLFLALCVLCFKDETYNHLRKNLSFGVHKILNQNYESTTMTFEEFYAEDLFKEIKEQIAYDGEWVAAFGMHPSILEYNGMHTLDGYMNIYPAGYKEQFRKVIAPALDESNANRAYFDNWGARAYLFSEEVGYAPVKIMPMESASLKIDIEAFQKLGGSYIISRVRINNREELKLEEVGSFTKEGTPYIIYVYRR